MPLTARSQKRREEDSTRNGTVLFASLRSAGVVDSIWVTSREGATDRSPLREIAEEITAEIEISLEYEGAFKRVAFCPRRDGDVGALNRYFGRRSDHEPTSDHSETESYK